MKLINSRFYTVIKIYIIKNTNTLLLRILFYKYTFIQNRWPSCYIKTLSFQYFNKKHK